MLAGTAVALKPGAAGLPVGLPNHEVAATLLPKSAPTTAEEVMVCVEPAACTTPAPSVPTRQVGQERVPEVEIGPPAMGKMVAILVTVPVPGPLAEMGTT